MVSNDVQRVFILLKVSLLMALLPASASAVTITITAPNAPATELTVTATGTHDFTSALISGLNIGNFLHNGEGPYGQWLDLSAGISANGVAATRLFLNNDPGSDDFYMEFGDSLDGTYAVSGSATVNLSGGDRFGDFTLGTYETGSTTLVVEVYVPDTGSTAALLGVGVAALAFARRRLG